MTDTFAPSLKRSWLEVELMPKDKQAVTSSTVDIFQKKLAEICGMHIFCGPMIIAPDSDNKLLPYYTNEKFKPRAWNSYMWWTQPEAKNVLSILDHSHTSFYYYPEHNLIDVSIATCKEYNLNDALKYIASYWKPDTKGIRYVFISPNVPTCSWQVYEV